MLRWREMETVEWVRGIDPPVVEVEAVAVEGLRRFEFMAVWYDDAWETIVDMVENRD